MYSLRERFYLGTIDLSYLDFMRAKRLSRDFWTEVVFDFLVLSTFIYKR